ncbi:FLUCTUATING-LIGHT-ACCLIMATION protein 1, chloroplastic [Wolffia australiana]
MALGFSQQAFVASISVAPPALRRCHPQSPPRLSCRASADDDDTNTERSLQIQRLAKLAVVAVAAGVLSLGPVDGAAAAKSGGRVGGQAFRSSAPRINKSRTNIYVNPPVAPPLVGGYGYASPYYGGFGWSPFSFFAPGPAIAVGVGGFDFLLPLLVLGAVASVLRGFLRRGRDEEDDEL